ncbi:DNA polymerase III subunit beta, partial [Wolbachia endosymbiont of Pentidionis agamae]|uniref:DNA polymerase III subunit beta n=1 Tax=Wolbachia endosymbiont of Pentidionis agamae TaxID=3110435 RepID=UPI002FD338F1
ALNKTKFSISLDGTRYNLNGMYMHSDNESLYFVATDSHRLSCIKKCKPDSVQGNFGIIIPRKTILELLKILDTSLIKIELSDRKIKFTCEEYIVLSKLIDGVFPNYNSFLSISPQSKQLIIESDRLASAIDRVSVIISDKVRSIKFLLDKNKLSLHASSESGGSAIEVLDVEYSNDSIEISFNARYLLEVLSCVKNHCKFNFTDKHSAVVITDEDYSDASYIVMPMRG